MEAPPPIVSVIVPAWGVAHLVGEALASLRAQDFAAWEAIVVDDGAPDDVAAAVTPFAAADPRIRFLATPHGGLPAARNHAIAAARGEFVALLDGDDAYLPDYLSWMVAAIAGDPALGLVTCDARYFGGTRRDGELFSRYNPQAGEPTLAAVIERRFNVFVASIARRAAIEAVGGFDEGLAAAEDLDMWLRLLGAGWKAGHVARPLVLYRRRAGSLSAATGRLATATAQVFEGAAERLAGRPEAAAATRMAARARVEAAEAEGEDLVLSGEARRGLSLMRANRTAGAGIAWRAATALFRVAPWTAASLIAWRRRAAFS